MATVSRNRHKRKRAPRPADERNPVVEEVLERIRASRNFDFRNYKRATLTRRIERRMQERGCRTMGDYLSLLERDPPEFDSLISAMLIKVTSFFRDGEIWQALSEKIVPQVLAEKRPGDEIRVWCAGCATGEEAFSLAMLIAEAMGPAFQNADVKIFGTDVDPKAVAFARRGIYPAAQVESMPANLRDQWLTRDGEDWLVKKEIRRAVVFGVNNLVSDAPISRLDLLVCRNVFIYLDSTLQRRVLTRFHYALRRHGILILGKSELIPFAGKIFEPVDLSRRIYRKDGRRESTVGQERLLNLLAQESADRGAEKEGSDPTYTQQFHHGILQSMNVPVVATIADGTVLAWNAAASALWGRSEAEVVGRKLPALNLPGMPGELLIERTNVVREGRSELEISQSTLKRASDNKQVQVAIEVTPLRGTTREVIGLVYLVRDVSELRETESELSKANADRQSAYEELQTINEEMQSSNEELETTNEELQSANEELQTTNEELQSTNEELETTNEELQSTNAELDATNRELAARTEEMNTLGFFRRAIIRSLSSAVVLLDANGRIQVWNVAAERLLGLTEDEATGQVLWTLHVPGVARPLLVKVRKSIANNQALRLEQVEYELPNGAPGRATVAAVPILDDGAPLGAVLIFEDTTRLSTAQAEIEEMKRDGRGRNRD